MEYFYGGVSLQNERPSNMDSLLLKKRCIHNKMALFAVVCDGVGSLTEGAFASGMAVRKLGEWFDHIESTERIGLELRDTILRINAHITTTAAQANIQTASTLSSLLLVDELFYIVHVGDSRIYSFDGATLSILTNDDVSESGKLIAYIGQTGRLILQYSEGTARNKTFLVCSDGLYKRMDARFMLANINADSMRMAQDSANSLAQYVIRQGEQDNISVALMKTIV